MLGVHLVGRGAAEMIQLAAVALRMGATKEDFDATMAVHPTAAEELVTMRTPVRIDVLKCRPEWSHASLGG